MSDFGDKLRQAREERGVSLRQIAAATKISMTVLEALERGEFSRLPGGIFSRAFVRAYATEIGLDPEQSVRSFLVEFERSESQAAEAAPPEVTADDREFLERQRQAARVLRGVLVTLLLLAVAAVVYWQLRPRAAPPLVEPQPAQPAQTSPRPSAVTPLTPAAPEPTALPDAARLNISIEVTAACFVQVNVDGAQTPALQRILNAGERQDFRAEREVVLVVGNAGAVRWSINGRAAKSLGRIGDRNRQRITRSNFRDFLQ